MAGKTPPRRGKRVVVGHLISMSGQLGGPWDGKGSTPKLPKVTKNRKRAYVWNFRDLAKDERDDYRRNGFPDAEVFPLVRYKLDPEEERLRDAVVEALLDMDTRQREYDEASRRADPRHVTEDAMVAVYSAASTLEKAKARFIVDYSALRAYLEKRNG